MRTRPLSRGSASLEQTASPGTRRQVEFAVQDGRASVRQREQSVGVPAIRAKSLRVPCPVPVRPSPLSGKLVAHQGEVAQLCPERDTVIVPRVTPKPVAVPPKLACISTPAAGTGVQVKVLALKEKSPICFAVLMSLPSIRYSPAVNTI